MSDGADLGLGNEDFFEDDDGGDLNRIFDEDDDDGQSNPLDKSEQKNPENEGRQGNLDDSDGDANNAHNDTGSQENDNKKVAEDDWEEGAEKGGDDDEDGKSKKKKRRRSSGSESAEGELGPSPAWHSEAADKPHRETMIKEISQLLQARKKTAPTKEWMQQLPHKARVLEDRLYRKAASLDGYLNRTTLKNRLRTLAVTITAHYKTSGKSRKKSKRSSIGSEPSTSSEGPHRESVSSNMGPPAQVSLQAQLLSAGGQASEDGVPSSGQMNMPPDGQDVVPPALAMSQLARQKAVNEELQAQILSNIRQQQQLVHNIRRGSNEMPGANGNGMHRGGIQGNSMDAPADAMAGQFNNMQNPNQMQAAMSGNNMQGGQFPNNSQGDNMNHRGSASSQSMANNAFEAQTNMMRQSSAPNNVGPSGGGGLNPGQAALMRQQSASAAVGGMNMQNAGMQANILRRTSSTGTPNQAQFHAQQTAMMRRNSNAAAQNQVAQAQMQAALMRQASAGNNQINAMQAQAALMRSNQMDPQTQAALMRQASAGPNQMNPQMGGAQAALLRQASGAGPGGPMMGGNPGMMGQQMGSTGNNMGMMPNGQMMPGFGGNQQMMMQANPAMMQSMNAMGMQQGMAQFSGLQQQMGMAAMQGRNSMMVMGNDGNAMDNMSFQGKKAGDDLGLSQNSFGW